MEVYSRSRGTEIRSRPSLSRTRTRSWRGNSLASISKGPIFRSLSAAARYCSTVPLAASGLDLRAEPAGREVEGKPGVRANKSEKDFLSRLSWKGGGAPVTKHKQFACVCR